MNDKELKHKVNQVMHELMTSTGGVVVPVEVLQRVGVLSKENYEKWRNGQVDYLEGVCSCNLSKLSTLMKEMRIFAKKNELKPSWTYYHGWAKAKDKKLRFSKSGNTNIEQSYATSYISTKTVNELKSEKNQ
ncbi:MAG: hypothetical protein LBE76_03660 [Nitrososphaerota archaeon]|jgi:hypothetical protein|nr:hypothetical protein [Nitrososphaerota archaeon]